MLRWDWRGRCSRFACMGGPASRHFPPLATMTACSGWSKFATSLAGRAGSICISTAWGRRAASSCTGRVWSMRRSRRSSSWCQHLPESWRLGEAAALIAWPTLLMAAALAFMLRIARAVGGDWALLPAFIICTAALFFGGVFVPGDIDHHNVQLTLTLAAMTALIIGRSHVAGIAAGAACALMLAVGMETLPYVAVAGLTVSAGYLLGGRAEAAKAAGFGIGFAGVGFAAFLATVPASAWLAPQCDAYSLPQFSVAMLSGLGLAAAAVSPALGRSFVGRLAALLALGVAVAVLAVAAFPQCLADPMPEWIRGCSNTFSTM